MWEVSTSGTRRAMADEIFSRQRRRLIRARARNADNDSRWLSNRAIGELIERFRFMTIDVRRALVFGDGADALKSVLPPSCQITRADLVDGHDVDVVCDEDRLPLTDAGFDLVFASGTLDTVHDLPGALILFRRALRPGGLFLGSLLGGGSMSGLRSLVQGLEEAAHQPAVARFHPQVDVRAAGDLMFRAGYSTPVADMDDFNVDYAKASTLIADLRANGLANALPSVRSMKVAVGKQILRKTHITERFSHLYLTGWAPLEGERRPSGPVKGVV